MMNSNNIAMLLAGGSEVQYGVLTARRAKAALPFGGMFRIVDFAMSNLSHAGIGRIGVIIQYLPGSLIEHIEVGHSWDLSGFDHKVKIMPPFVGVGDTIWYKGTADALLQNVGFIHRFDPDNVIVCYGEHVFYCDFADVLRFHREMNADLTAVSRHAPASKISERLCRLICERKTPQNVKRCAVNAPENEEHPACTGIYVFKTAVLLDALENLKSGTQKAGYSVSRHIIFNAPQQYRVFNYPLKTYWSELNTIEDYFENNMSLLNPNAEINIGNWGVMTNPQDRGVGYRPPAFLGEGATMADSIISPGCRIDGDVYRSVLSPGVIVERGAHVENSILWHDCKVERDARLKFVIADKDSVFGAGVQLGSSQARESKFGDIVPTLTLIGKREVVNANCEL